MFNKDNVLISIDPFSLRYLGDVLKIDYVDHCGFKLVTPEEILAFGLNIKGK